MARPETEKLGIEPRPDRRQVIFARQVPGFEIERNPRGLHGAPAEQGKGEIIAISWITVYLHLVTPYLSRVLE